MIIITLCRIAGRSHDCEVKTERNTLWLKIVIVIMLLRSYGDTHDEWASKKIEYGACRKWNYLLCSTKSPLKSNWYTNKNKGRFFVHSFFLGLGPWTSMFTLLYLFACLLHYLYGRLEYRHKIVILQILFLLTTSLHHLQSKKRSDAVIRSYVLQTRQEITAANEPSSQLS